MSDAEPMVELDAEALALLAMYRNEERVPEDLRGRVWARIEAGPSAAAHDAAPPSESGRGATVRWVALGMAIAAGLLLAVVGVRGAVLTEAPGEEVRPEAVLEHASEASAGQVEDGAMPPKRARPGSRSTPAPPAESEPAVLDPEPEPEPEPEPAPRTKRPRDPAPTSAETLAAETELLKGARAALAAGQTQRCLTLLARHAQDFPRGVLAEERDALRVVALCSTEYRERGEAAARAFRRRYPASPLLRRVDNACSKSESAP